MANFGRIDIAVTNAAIFLPIGTESWIATNPGAVAKWSVPDMVTP